MIQPLKNNVLIRPLAADEVSEGGIVVPESARKPSNKVEIVAVGTGTSKTPMQFTPGQIAFRTKDAGKECEVLIDGVQHFFVDQSWILAVLN